MAKEYCNNEVHFDTTESGKKLYTENNLKYTYLGGFIETRPKCYYVKDGDLPRQYGHTCFSIDVLANNKKRVYYDFSSGKWFCGNKEVKVIAWKEIIPPKEIK